MATANGRGKRHASPAAVYRAIGSDNPPTLLVDEADTIFGGKNADANEDLRGLLNAGHQRNRPAIRWDASTQRLEKIPTFAMAALAGIGAMPDTIEDRAVVVRMRRRAQGGTVAPYRHRRDTPALRAVAQRLAVWLGANLSTLEAAEPPMPVEDRAADTWEPLVAVADLAGDTWPARARQAVTVLTAEADEAGNLSTRVRLLADVRTAFTLLGDPPAASTHDLLAALNGEEEAGRVRANRPHRQATRRPAPRIRHHLGHHPVPRRAGQGLHPRRLHRRVERVLPRPIRTIRTNVVSAAQPRYGCRPWYGSIRTSDPIRTAPGQAKRAWYGWDAYPAMALGAAG